MILTILLMLLSFLLGFIASMLGFARMINSDVRLRNAWDEYAVRKELNDKKPNR